MGGDPRNDPLCVALCVPPCWVQVVLVVKLVDFGLAKMLGVGHSVALSMSGTPQYIAPEILSSRAKYSFPVDCWSVGVVMYLLLSGCFPFEPRDSAILDDSMVDVEEYVEVSVGLVFFPVFSLFSIGLLCANRWLSGLLNGCSCASVALMQPVRTASVGESLSLTRLSGRA